MPAGTVAVSAAQLALWFAPARIGLAGIDLTGTGTPRFYEQAGDKAMSRVVDNKVARWLPKGVAFVSINYRMLPQTDPVAQADDVARALAKAQALAPSWGTDPARFVLIGTMNPAEGELRPQLLDRFGLNVALEGLAQPEARQQIIRRRLAFDSDPQAFCAQSAQAQAQLRERCHGARQRLERIPLDDQALAWITERCFAAGVDGLRADLVWLRAARAHAAWRGGETIEQDDVQAVAEFALRHRRRASPPDTPPHAATSAGNGQTELQGGPGDWGALPPQAVPSGARREVPNWAKKP